jgi:pyruvate kinase
VAKQSRLERGHSGILDYWGERITSLVGTMWAAIFFAVLAIISLPTALATGDLVIIVAGAPPGTVGSTNLIHIHRIGENDH